MSCFALRKYDKPVIYACPKDLGDMNQMKENDRQLSQAYTGQRRSDVVKMGYQHVKDGMISVVQQKTGKRLWIPLHSDL